MRNCTLFKNLLWLMLVFVAGNTMAQTVLLEEDFSKCTSAQPDNPASVKDGIDNYTLMPGWTVVSWFPGEGNMKFGSSKKGGSITTPELDLSDKAATYTLSFKACAWAGDPAFLYVSVDENTATEVAIENGSVPYAASLKKYSLEVEGTATSKITIASKSLTTKGRFFIDDIKVTKLASGETPAPAVTAPTMVAFGSVQAGTTVSEDVTITGANLTDDLTVAIEGEGFSCEFTAIPKDDAALGAELSVEFAPTAEGDYSGTLTISGGGLAEPVVVALTGSAVALTGDGSKENPYTVEDVMKLQNPNQKYWVKGVIVGFVNGQSISTGSIFDLTSAETVSNLNLLLAAEAGVTDPALCVPVQLPAGEIRTALNLSDNPANLGRELLINGNLTAYFGVPGVKEPTVYEFVKVGNDPAVTAPASVSLGLVQVGGTASKDVTVSGSDLTGDLTVAIAGEGFSCETTTIAKDEAAQGAVLNVVFTPTAEGEYTGTLTISGGGLAEAVTVALTGECVTLEGDGSKENPYTVADVMKLQNPNKAYWVKGVIVGLINGKSISDGAIFDLSSAETISNSNLLLAAEAGVTDPALCVPVQLPSKTEVRTALNLSDNPTNLGRELLIYGSLEAYFSVPGIKSPTEYVLGNPVAVENVEAALENDAQVEVYTLGGVKVGDSLNGLAKGIYVVKQGNQVKKVVK